MLSAPFSSYTILVLSKQVDVLGPGPIKEKSNNCPKVDLKSACNALQFIYCQALIEGYSLLKSEDISVSKAQKAWNKSTIIECRLIDENIEYLEELMDLCYFSAKKVLVECISNDAKFSINRRLEIFATRANTISFTK